MANTATCIEKPKEKGQKDKVGINDIGIFEFIFHGLPNLPELEGMDEDRLRELQMPYKSNYIKEMKKEKEILLKEFKKTFDFVNSHLLKE